MCVCCCCGSRAAWTKAGVAYASSPHRPSPTQHSPPPLPYAPSLCPCRSSQRLMKQWLACRSAVCGGWRCWARSLSCPTRGTALSALSALSSERFGVVLQSVKVCGSVRQCEWRWQALQACCLAEHALLAKACIQRRLHNAMQGGANNICRLAAGTAMVPSLLTFLASAPWTLYWTTPPCPLPTARCSSTSACWRSMRAAASGSDWGI